MNADFELFDPSSKTNRIHFLSQFRLLNAVLILDGVRDLVLHS